MKYILIWWKRSNYDVLNVIWEIVGIFLSDLEKRNNISMLERGRYGMLNL